MTDTKRFETSGHGRTNDGAQSASRVWGRREFLAALAVGAVGCKTLPSIGPLGASSKGKPNVILIYLDDLGCLDLGCYGATDLKTPHIDALAEEGARCTNGYVTCSVCSPSRAGLLTGRYQQRFGYEDNTGSVKRQEEEDIGLPLSEITIAEALKAEGYATGAIGKWHQGVQDKFHPLNRGFDEFFGHLGGAHSYFKWDDGPWGPIYRGWEPAEGEGYLTDAFNDEAVDFIRRHRNEPYFLYLAYNAVHSPMQAPQEYLDRFPDITNKNRRAMAAMLSAVDDGVGAIVKTLRETGADKDTLIFLINDNGGAKGNGTINDPFRGKKTTQFEGGIRVPYIVRWTGRIPAGLVYEKPVSTLDVFSTAVAAVGGEMPQDRVMDGVDLVPYFDGRNQETPHEVLYWRRNDNFAIRKGNWKLVKYRYDPPQLFNLSVDIGEENDLAQRRPEKAQELLDEHKRWSDQMAEPLWHWFGKKKVARNSGPAKEAPRRSR